VALGIRSAHEIEHDVDAAPLRALEASGGEGFLAMLDHDVGAPGLG